MGCGRRQAGASAADLLEQRHHGGQALDVLDLVPVCVVNAPELSQQAQQLCVQKPLEEVVGSPGKEENKVAESLILRSCSPELPSVRLGLNATENHALV